MLRKWPSDLTASVHNGQVLVPLEIFNQSIFTNFDFGLVKLVVAALVILLSSDVFNSNLMLVKFPV